MHAARRDVATTCCLLAVGSMHAARLRTCGSRTLAKPVPAWIAASHVHSGVDGAMPECDGGVMMAE